MPILWSMRPAPSPLTFIACNCPSFDFIPYENISTQIRGSNVFNDKSWKQHNKFKVTWKGKRYILKTETPHFEIMYHIISKTLKLAHCDINIYITRHDNSYMPLLPWYENVTHGWHLYHICTNVTDRYTFDVLYNDFLMGYSDRAPNRHMSGGKLVPIDQDSGSYTAILPSQTDRVYTKHILHNMMVKNEPACCAAFNAHLPCASFLHYDVLRKCLPNAFRHFPLHSTRLDHILYRYNESREYSCNCLEK